MEDTAGFYKLDGDLLYGPNFVLNKDYELRRETHADHTYPIDGWSWFDSAEDAYTHHGLEIPKIDEESPSPLPMLVFPR